MTSPLPYAEEALAISEKMVSACEADDWAEVLKLEKQRVQVLETCFEKPIDKQFQPQVADYIKKMQSINEVLMEKAEQKRVNIKDSSINHQRKNHASKAYVQVKRFL